MDNPEYFAELVVGSGAIGCTAFVLHRFGFHTLDTVVLLVGAVVVTVWLIWRTFQCWPPHRNV